MAQGDQKVVGDLMKKWFLIGSVVAMAIVLLIVGYVLLDSQTLTLNSLTSATRDFAMHRNLPISRESLNISPDEDTLKKIKMVLGNDISGHVSLTLDDRFVINGVSFNNERNAKKFADNAAGENNFLLQKDNVMIELMGEDWRLKGDFYLQFRPNSIMKLIKDIDESGLSFGYVVSISRKSMATMSQKNNFKISDAWACNYVTDKGEKAQTIVFFAFPAKSRSFVQDKLKRRNVIVGKDFAIEFMNDEDNVASEKIKLILADKKVKVYSK